MNDYRITYTYNAEDGTRENIRITERSEAAARKDFKAHHKDGTILDVELVAENVPATKSQEREALAKIKQMVEELGPGSYVGTAFEGCFEDAESNIEYDYGCSMKQKLESAEFAEDQLREKLAAANARLEELGHLIDSLKEERRTFEVELEKRTLPQWIREGLASTMSAASYYATEYMERAADKMANNAENLLCVAFKEAVEEYRRGKELRERCEKLLYTGLAFQVSFSHIDSNANKEREQPFWADLAPCFCRALFCNAPKPILRRNPDGLQGKSGQHGGKMAVQPAFWHFSNKA